MVELIVLDVIEFVGLGLGLEVMGRGRSSSGLKEDKEDPVEDPLTCLDNPDKLVNGLLWFLSDIFMRLMSRFNDEILFALLAAWIIKMII